MNEPIQCASDLEVVLQKRKTRGWMAAACAFVFLAISNFWFWGGFLAAGCFVNAGWNLFRSERVKSALVILVAGFLGAALSSPIAIAVAAGNEEVIKIDDEFVRLSILLLCGLLLLPLYIGVVSYFKTTRLFLMSLFVGVVLVVLHLCLIFWNLGYIIALFHLVFALFFVSRKYLQLEDAILRYGDPLIKILSKYVINPLRPILLKYVMKPLRTIQTKYHESSYRVCFIYGCSVFVVGVICFAVLLFWASPGIVHLDVQDMELKTWNCSFIVSAITQLVACAIGGCFIFSQLSLARKLRDKQITEGSTPKHLLVARCFFVILAVLIAVGVVYVFVEDSKTNDNETHWATYLTMSNIPLLVSYARHSWPKVSITLSSIVAIWHLLGASFVIKLISDNTAKILSMGSSSDITTDAA